MRKKYLSSLVITVVILAAAGLWGYNSFLKPNLEIQKQLTNEFGNEFFNSFDDAKTAETPTTTSVLHELEQNAAAQMQVNPGYDNISSAQTTEQAIIQKYAPKFQGLENQALGRLDVLFAAGLREYTQQKKSGTLKASELARKYIQAGNMLEANVDSQFYGTLNAMEAELVENHLPTAVIADIKKEYVKAKSSKRAELLAKAYR